MPAAPEWVVPLRGLDITHIQRYGNGDLLMAGLKDGLVGKIGDVSLEEAIYGRATLLARIGKDGALVWYRQFDTDSYTGLDFESVTAAAIGPAGECVIVGNYHSPVDFGDGTLEANDDDMFIASFTAEGTLVWSRSLTGSGLQYGHAAAIAADGKVYVGGGFEDTLVVGDDMLVSDGGTDILLARYSSAGVPEWARGWGGTLDDSALALAVDHAGDVVMLAEVYNDDTDFGNGPIVGIGCCKWNSVVAKFDPNGENVWAVAFGVSDYTAGLTVGPDNQIAATSKGTVVAFSDGGDVLWETAKSGIVAYDVAFNSDGEVLAGGFVPADNVSDLGDGPIGPFAENPSVTARYGAEGKLLSKQVYIPMEDSGDSGAIVSDVRVVQAGPGGEETILINGWPDYNTLDVGGGPVAGDDFLVRRYK